MTIEFKMRSISFCFFKKYDIKINVYDNNTYTHYVWTVQTVNFDCLIWAEY